MDYRSAGVDVAAGRQFVHQIRDLVAQTHRPEVLGGLGGFSGLFQLGQYQQPLLVAGTDGVGTKLKLAHDLNRHDTVGIDLVAMCVNDVLTCGAEPLFFLDYVATGHLEPDQLVEVVRGITQGCQQAGCALLGGETAEMPGFYQPGDYDLAGFCVGVVEKANLVDGSRMAVGDRVIALASHGVHSNGYSLVRKIIADGGWAWDAQPPEFQGKTLGDVFLNPTAIYVQPLLSAQRAGIELRGMAHITGGGLPENLPRCLGSGLSVALDRQSWTIPPVFQWLAAAGSVTESNMFETFNMGVGFVAVVAPDQADRALAHFQDQGLGAWVLGEVIAGDGAIVGLPT
ncbi:phosphoribosylformylglycinamidine cyclo-ligase [Prochlorothrix hollandica]|uniref:Phosphoribosylformylglycinamidine cyclo-ligase n=1 Tax=Prochlorothrix hollandica PCC 9006 = CALU 1027 TaxID=317619 RepID=A0A0M2PRP9_PROHO|nr:phosphoribosylformylglycinamidine cyclo-ligase [Prochlorothrix hollandica]KKI99215.1 phosphoribosylformylglycinamidine cyclo-ligase [Prochlorothrix hollandica PCC 9006 = CALU 1027]